MSFLHWVTDLEERAVLDDDVVHVSSPEVGKVSGEGNEVGGVVGTVELEELRLGRAGVAAPSELIQPRLQLSVGVDHLVGG